MSQLVKINDHDLQIKVFNNQRVVTFKDIDKVHERSEGTAGRNFRENKEHFIEGTDYFFVKPADIQTDEIRRSEINNSGTYLITESGYLMLVKSLTDDLAWKVQRELVNNYFRVKEQRPTCIEDVLIESLQEMKAIRLQLSETQSQVSAVKQEVEDVKEVITINPGDDWRTKTNTIVSKICKKLGDYKLPKDEIYRALEQRAKCKLKIRLENMKGRVLKEGMSKSKADALNFLDVISVDNRLKEIYIAIVKEMAIKHGIQA